MIRKNKDNKNEERHTLTAREYIQREKLSRKIDILKKAAYEGTEIANETINEILKNEYGE